MWSWGLWRQRCYRCLQKYGSNFLIGINYLWLKYWNTITSHSNVFKHFHLPFQNKLGFLTFTVTKWGLILHGWIPPTPPGPMGFSMPHNYIIKLACTPKDWTSACSKLFRSRLKKGRSYLKYCFHGKCYTCTKK